jgi:hypothetical protein
MRIAADHLRHHDVARDHVEAGAPTDLRAAERGDDATRDRRPEPGGGTGCGRGGREKAQ